MIIIAYNSLDVRENGRKNRHGQKVIKLIIFF